MVVRIRKGWVEAAARLGMWASFDKRLFDTFCVFLQGDDDCAIEDPGDGAAHLLAPSPPSERPAPYIRLQEWLLELSCELLNPRAADAALDPSERSFKLLGFSDSLRMDGPEDAFAASGSAAPTGADSYTFGRRRTSATIANLPGNETVAATVVWKLDSSPDLEWGDALQLDSSAAQRFAYFEGRVARLQIWREDNGELFRMLKERIQGFMDGLAQMCDRRFQDLCGEASGAELRDMRMVDQQPQFMASLGWEEQPPTTVMFGSQAAHQSVWSSLAEGPLVLRQDHREAGAVRMDEGFGSFREAELQARMFPRQLVLNEEVFLSQLSERSHLLNDAFQHRMLALVREHGVPDLEISQGVPSASQDGKAHTIRCTFDEGAAPVLVMGAPPKRIDRMREKLAKYCPPHGKGLWPLTANILDPVRTSIVCSGASQILQVMRWFTGASAESGLRVVRVKNKFASPSEEILDGYRDLSLSVLFIGEKDLRIIGEIQIHDMFLYNLKTRMHKLYKVKRAADADSL